MKGKIGYGHELSIRSKQILEVNYDQKGIGKGRGAKRETITKQKKDESGFIIHPVYVRFIKYGNEILSPTLQKIVIINILPCPC